MARDIEDGILTLVAAGFDQHEVIHEWPWDKFQLLRKAAARRELENRQQFVMDVAAAVGGTLGGKGLPRYLEDMKDVADYDL